MKLERDTGSMSLYLKQVLPRDAIITQRNKTCASIRLELCKRANEEEMGKCRFKIILEKLQEFFQNVFLMRMNLSKIRFVRNTETVAL